MNIALAVFNMLPIPPLDGSRVAEGLMPLRLRPLWNSYAQYGPLVLMLVIFVLPRMHIDLLAWPFAQITGLTIRLMQALRGA